MRNVRVYVNIVHHLHISVAVLIMSNVTVANNALKNVNNGR